MNIMNLHLTTPPRLLEGLTPGAVHGSVFPPCHPRGSRPEPGGGNRWQHAKTWFGGYLVGNAQPKAGGCSTKQFLDFVKNLVGGYLFWTYFRGWWTKTCWNIWDEVISYLGWAKIRDTFKIVSFSSEVDSGSYRKKHQPGKTPEDVDTS